MKREAKPDSQATGVTDTGVTDTGVSDTGSGHQAPSAEERLELMPRVVRDKLDRVGMKLHLRQWQLLPMADRERLRDWPCDQADEVARYAAEVERLVLHLTGQAPDRLKPRV